jgi:hypothetical protein
MAHKKTVDMPVRGDLVRRQQTAATSEWPPLSDLEDSVGECVSHEKHCELIFTR